MGLILGGLLTEYASWRWCLFVNVPIALLAAAAAVVTVPRQDAVAGPRRYDVAGALTVTAASVALVYGLTVAGEGAGWLAPFPVALLVAAAVLLVTFVVFERRSASPLLPLRVVTDRLRGASFVASAAPEPPRRRSARPHPTRSCYILVNRSRGGCPRESPCAKLRANAVAQTVPAGRPGCGRRGLPSALTHRRTRDY